MKRVASIIIIVIIASTVLLCAAPLQAAQGSARAPAMDIKEYYERASKTVDEGLPDGLRVAAWDHPGARNRSIPVIVSPCLRYDSGEFGRLFFTSPYSKRLREIFAEGGVNADKVASLLKVHGARSREVVSVFDEGYMIITDPDEKRNYIFPVPKGLGQKLFGLSE
jgi:hypothetical protein